MTGQNVPPSSASHGSTGSRLIGAGKCLHGFLLLVAGLGLFHLINADLGAITEQFILAFHLDEHDHIAKAILKFGGLDHKQIRELGATAFFYAGLEFVEGAGLFYRQLWAQYLTIASVSLFLLPECYEIYLKQSPIRIAIFIFNIGVVCYLGWDLRRDLKRSREELSPSRS